MATIPWKRWPKKPPPRRFISPVKPGSRRTIVPLKEWHIVRGDKVQLLTGRDIGKQGTVSEVVRRYNQLYVEGLNLEHKFYPPVNDFEGGYMATESPLHVRDVKLVDPSTGQPTDIIYRYTEEGKRVRVSLDSGRIIPKPLMGRTDFKSRAEVKDGDFDTAASDASKSTYVPSLLLFHEEIMKELNVHPSIPKNGPERRDLIVKELIAQGETESTERNVVEQESSSLWSRTLSEIQNILSCLKFWS